MTASHQSGPHYIGPESPRTEPSAQGAVALCQKYDIADVTTLTSGTGFDAFRIPVDAELLDVSVLIVTASDSATSATIKLTDGTNDLATGFDAKSAANSLLSVKNGDGAVADAGRWLARAAGAETLQLVYTEVGTATVGRAVVYIWYIQKA